MSNLYKKELSKVISQRNELAELLSDVLEAWNSPVTYAIDDHQELFMKANEYLMRLENE